MQARIVRIDQSFPLDGTAVQNFLVLELPGAGQIRAVVDEEVVQQVIAALDFAAPPPPPHGNLVPAAMTADDVPPGSVPIESASLGTLEIASPPRAVQSRRRTVPRTEYGYPIVEQRDPGELPPGADEDGVGSI